jgi:hypothetical protein
MLKEVFISHLTHGKAMHFYKRQYGFRKQTASYKKGTTTLV